MMPSAESQRLQKVVSSGNGASLKLFLDLALFGTLTTILKSKCKQIMTVEAKVMTVRMTRAAARAEHGQRRESKLTALFDSKPAKKLRSMHNIQQARPRALSH